MATEQELQSQIFQLKKKIDFLTAQIKSKSFGLSWIDVPEAFESLSEDRIPVLEEMPDKDIITNEQEPTHIFIEGDNFHALTCLNYTHRNKVDIIYIDPPYNTGSDGFTFKDKRFLEEYPDGTTIPRNHPLRHSSWLSFMGKRLRLAYPLLKDDGVIFISINEDEYANLKLLCDSIFLSENYVTTFTIKVRHEDRILKGDKPIHETTEFLLMYQKSSKFRIRKRIKDTSAPDEYQWKITELIDNPEVITLGGKEVKVFKPGEYRLEKVEPSFENLKEYNIRGTLKTGNSSGRFHMSYLESRNNLFNYLYKVPGIGDDGLGYRYFRARKNARQANGFYYQGAPVNREDTTEIPYPNYFDFEPIFNSVGTEGGVPFDGGKKPVAFLQQFFKIAKGDKDDILVLDFFGGSGSTGHAIIDRNMKGSKSRAIIVQLPEATFEIKNGKKEAKSTSKNAFNAGYMSISDITYDRLKNVIKGYTDAKGVSHDAMGNNLVFYKTAFIGENQPSSATDKDKAVLASKAGCLLAMTEDTLFHVGEKPYYQFFTNKVGKYTAVYHQEDYSKLEEFIKEVKALDGDVAVYIFCWTDGSEFAEEFIGSPRVVVKPIPQPILDIYNSIINL